MGISVLEKVYIVNTYCVLFVQIYEEVKKNNAKFRNSTTKTRPGIHKRKNMKLNARWKVIRSNEHLGYKSNPFKWDSDIFCFFFFLSYTTFLPGFTFFLQCSLIYINAQSESQTAYIHGNVNVAVRCLYHIMRTMLTLFGLY